MSSNVSDINLKDDEETELLRKSRTYRLENKPFLTANWLKLSTVSCPGYLRHRLRLSLGTKTTLLACAQNLIGLRWPSVNPFSSTKQLRKEKKTQVIS